MKISTTVQEYEMMPKWAAEDVNMMSFKPEVELLK
jgi:hypothetical protein